MRNYRLSNPSQVLRQSSVHLDNLILVPASFLPFKAEWQAIANKLPPGAVLVGLPVHAKQRRIAVQVVTFLRQRGRPVKVLPNRVAGDSVATRMC